MKDEIKEILDIEKYRNKDGYVENISLSPSEIHKLLDYITNLQEELDRCVKANIILDDENAELQGEKQNLQEENERLKELCDKYEEEHSTEFKIWKDERHQLLDYKSRNKKAREYIKENIADIEFMEENYNLDFLNKNEVEVEYKDIKKLIELLEEVE